MEKMTIVGDRCPCGSGLLKQKCCQNVIPFRRPKSDGEAPAEVTTTTPNPSTREEWEAMSPEEKHDWFYSAFDDFDSGPLDRFLGLSDRQFIKVLSPRGLVPDNLVFEARVKNQALYDSAPLVKKALRLIECCSIKEGVKLTPKGNLPRTICLEFMDWKPNDPLYPKPNSVNEPDVPMLPALKYSLIDMGYLRKTKGKLFATKKGISCLASQNRGQLFEDIFEYWLSLGLQCARFYLDPLFEISTTFLIYMMSLENHDEIKEQSLSAKLLAAIPELERSVHEYTSRDKFGYFAFEIDLYFLRRFCMPFGFVAPQEGDLGARFGGPYKITDLFRDFFRFKIQYNQKH